MHPTQDSIRKQPVLTDDELMERIQSGNTAAGLNELRRRHGGRVFRLADRIVRDHHLAEDVTEEVFEKVVFKNKSYRLGTNFCAWLMEVTRNHALSTLRARRGLPRYVGSMVADDSE